MSCLPRLPDELLHEIFSSPCLSQHDRSALTRVSKDWHHVATPVLWRQLPGLLPLLKLIPEDAWASEPIQYEYKRHPDDPTERITITRRLEEKDWARVYRRASLVKTLVIHASYSPLYSECTTQTVEAIAACHPSRCLLPDLRSLHIVIDLRYAEDSHAHSTSLLKILISPDAIGDLVEDLSLKYDRGFARKTDLHVAMLVNTVATRWTRLKSVSLQLVLCDPSLLATFSQIPTLESLKLRFERSARERDIIPASLAPGFPSLRTLVLRPVDSEAAAAVLRCWDLRALQSFVVDDIHCKEPSDLQYLLQAVHDRIAHSALRKLAISQNYVGPPPLLFRHLRPLASFRRLVHVDINVDVGLYITDDEHAQLASCWPDAEYISFKPESNFTSLEFCTPASLAALVHYARYCPRLRHLSLSLVARPPIPDIPADVSSHAARHPLTHLDLGGSPFEVYNVGCVTHFISDLFPRVHRVEYSYGPHDLAWMQVNVELEYKYCQ